jgi:O-antigen ligase
MKGLVLTYLVTAIASVGALRYPLLGLYAYVGFAVLRPQSIWGWAGDLNRMSFIVGVALLIGWTLKGFGSWQFGRARLVVTAFLFFFIWFVLAATQAHDPSLAYHSVVDLSKLVLPFMVGVTLMRTEEDWRPLLWTIVLAQGYVGLEMNMNYLRGFNEAATGFGGMDNNCFAVSLLSVVGPAIALAISSKSWLARGLAAVAAALILHTILLTFSRGGMVGLIGVGVVAFIMMPKRPRYLAVILVSLLVVLRLTGPQLAARYSTAFVSQGERDGSAQSRLDLWRDCVEVIVAHPVLGIGPNNWRAIASTFGWTAGKSAHSVWMETAAEVGIPGVLALMLFFGIAGMKLWPIARARPTPTTRYEVGLAMGVVLSIAGFVIGGQFVSVPGLEVPYYVTMLGIVMLKSRVPLPAAAAVVAPPQAQSYRPPPGPAHVPVVASPTIGPRPARPMLIGPPRSSQDA